MTQPLLPDNKETHFPTEDEELVGIEDQVLHVNPTDKLEASYESVKQVVREHQWRNFWWNGSKAERFVDVQTAQLLVAVHDAMGKQAQEKMERMIAASCSDFEKVVRISWQCVK